MIKHTPRPWEWFHYKRSSLLIAREAHYVGGIVRLVLNSGCTPEERDANAALIAAAPDLKTALEALYDWVVSVGWEQESHIKQLVEAALSKAEPKP